MRSSDAARRRADSQPFSLPTLPTGGLPAPSSDYKREKLVTDWLHPADSPASYYSESESEKDDEESDASDPATLKAPFAAYCSQEAKSRWTMVLPLITESCMFPKSAKP